MKKICFISNLFPSKKDPSFGSFVGLSYQQLKDMGYKLEDPIVINARMSRFKKLIAYVIFFFSGVNALIKESCDFFYFHYLTYSTLCLLPILPFKRVSYVINIHGDDLVGDRLIHKIMGFPSPYILKHAIAIVVPSAFFKRRLLIMHDFVDDKKVIISESSGFNEKIFFPKKTLSKSEKKIHFGYISRIDEGKGWELMLEALQKLKLNNPEQFKRTTLSVYGAGSQVEQFNAMIHQFGLENVVTYYGPLAQSELGDKYRSFDYFLFPTRRESFGLVAVEALACGIPVICSHIEPLTDFISDKANGYLFQDGNVDDLYQCILNCYSVLKSEYSTLSDNAIKSVDCYKSEVVCKCLHQNLVKRGL
ncbi:MAG: glycosyltransferase family 4 protein [Alteromonadaceae bacterium]|nr:glycosyltransferase family 4 protein [Alteromonadaceae bacterium]